MCAVHTGLQPFLDFWLDLGMPPVQMLHFDPNWLEFEIGMILDLHPAENQVPGTPGVSHGTKKISSKFFSDHENMMLFYAFCGLVSQKMLKNDKNWQFLVIFAVFWIKIIE